MFEDAPHFDDVLLNIEADRDQLDKDISKDNCYLVKCSYDQYNS